MRLLFLALLLAAPVSLHAASFEISGITIDLPGYTERTGTSTNQIAQKRALRNDGKVSFAGGKFRHPKGTVVQHVGAMLAIGSRDLAEFSKHAQIMGVPPADYPAFYKN